MFIKAKSLFYVIVLAGVVLSFTKNPRLDSLGDNTALYLGPYTCVQDPNDNIPCASITDFGGFIYDKYYHRMLMFGGGHAATMRTDIDVFDFNLLTWKSAYPSVSCSEMTIANYDSITDSWKSKNHPVSQHSYDLLVIADTTKEFLVIRIPGGLNTNGTCANPAVAYHPGRIPHIKLSNISTGAWTFSKVGPGIEHTDSGWDRYPAAEYDKASGMVIILGGGSLWRYDPAAQAKFKCRSASVDGVANELVYFPPNDKFYYFATCWTSPAKVYEVTLNRSNWAASTITHVSGMTGTLPYTSGGDAGETGFAYDSVSRVIGGGIRDGRFFTYNPLTKAWNNQMITTHSTQSIGTQVTHCLEYDPVNNVFIILAYNRNSADPAIYTWAYRYRSLGTSIYKPKRIYDGNRQPKGNRTYLYTLQGEKIPNGNRSFVKKGCILQSSGTQRILTISLVGDFLK